MIVSTTEVRPLTHSVVHCCPLCGAVLDPKSEALLCPDCELDQAEKWSDYCAELEQAWYPC